METLITIAAVLTMTTVGTLTMAGRDVRRVNRSRLNGVNRLMSRINLIMESFRVIVHCLIIAGLVSVTPAGMTWFNQHNIDPSNFRSMVLVVLAVKFTSNSVLDLILRLYVWRHT